jgi:hypothetical protein
MEGLLKDIKLSTETYLKAILEEVCDTYELPKEEVLKKYLSGDHEVILPTPNRSQKREVVPKPDANMCKGLTAKGGPCKFVAQPGCELCGIHLRKSGQSSSKAVEEKVLCKGLTAKGGPCKFVAKAGCEYCGTHLKKMGETSETNSTPTPKPKTEKEKEKEPEKEKEKEEKVMSLQDRLNKIMAGEDEEEEEEEIGDISELVHPSDLEEAEKLKNILEEDEETYNDQIDILPGPNEALISELVGKKTSKKLKEILTEEEDSDMEEEEYIKQMSDTPKSMEKLNDILEGM